MTELHTLTEVEKDLTLGDTLENSDGDHDKFAHYVVDGDLLAAMLTGEPLTALCGKVWVPSKFAEQDRTVCPECKDLYDALPE